MDFNKEEAVRAMGIAEGKLLNNDFAAASRIAMRAKKLDSDLESLNLILSICDVLCAAENKTDGKKMDWHGILQIEQTADESLINKQYRKLALLLHPDKNHYPGAEAAFNLIGEARMILLDLQKHLLHNSASVKTHSAQYPAEKPPGPQNNSNPFSAKPSTKNVKLSEPRAKPKTSNKSCERVSFWTECSVCGYKNDFIVGKLGEPFICHSCEKSFVPQTMSLGTRSCSEAITPEMAKKIPASTWFEIFGIEDNKVKGSKRRRTVASKPQEPDVKKQRRMSSKAT